MKLKKFEEFFLKCLEISLLIFNSSNIFLLEKEKDHCITSLDSKKKSIFYSYGNKIPNSKNGKLLILSFFRTNSEYYSEFQGFRS
jgi:hypothetical protein